MTEFTVYRFDKNKTKNFNAKRGSNQSRDLKILYSQNAIPKWNIQNYDRVKTEVYYLTERDTSPVSFKPVNLSNKYLSYHDFIRLKYSKYSPRDLELNNRRRAQLNIDDYILDYLQELAEYNSLRNNIGIYRPNNMNNNVSKHNNKRNDQPSENQNRSNQNKQYKINPANIIIDTRFKKIDSESEDEMDNTNNDALIDSKDSKRANGDSPKNQNERDSIPKRSNNPTDVLIDAARYKGLNKDNDNNIIKPVNVLTNRSAEKSKPEEDVDIPSLLEKSSKRESEIRDSSKSRDLSADTAPKNDKRSSNERQYEILAQSIAAEKESKYKSSVSDEKRSSVSRLSSIFRNKKDKEPKKTKETKDTKDTKEKRVSFFDRIKPKRKSNEASR